jgi:hypothetical protein
LFRLKNEFLASDEASGSRQSAVGGQYSKMKIFLKKYNKVRISQPAGILFEILN